MEILTRTINIINRCTNLYRDTQQWMTPAYPVTPGAEYSAHLPSARGKPVGGAGAKAFMF